MHSFSSFQWYNTELLTIVTPPGLTYFIAESLYLWHPSPISPGPPPRATTNLEDFRIKQVRAAVMPLPLSGRLILGQPFWFPALFSVKKRFQYSPGSTIVVIVIDLSAEDGFPKLVSTLGSPQELQKIPRPLSHLPRECGPGFGISQRFPDKCGIETGIKPALYWTLNIS